VLEQAPPGPLVVNSAWSITAAGLFSRMRIEEAPDTAVDLPESDIKTARDFQSGPLRV
jgi:hypothetical protein